MSAGADDDGVSVIFATHNGQTTLPKMLTALGELREPPGGWRLIVANNSSTDQTASILNQFMQHLPLEIVWEPARGKNRALNAAIPRARGELVVFTDDDVVPRPDWLCQMQAAAVSHPDYDVFGGPIEPLWPQKPPQWLLEDMPLSVILALTKPEYTEGPDLNWRIMGPNMAVRRSVLDKGHRFDAEIGRSVWEYIMGSETEFIHRIARYGHASWFCTSAVVWHIIREHQMSLAWIAKRGFRYGRARRRLALKDEANNDKPQFFGAPRWMWRALLHEYFNLGCARIARDEVRHAKAAWEVEFLRGYIHEGRSVLR